MGDPLYGVSFSYTNPSAAKRSKSITAINLPPVPTEETDVDMYWQNLNSDLSMFVTNFSKAWDNVFDSATLTSKRALEVV